MELVGVLCGLAAAFAQSFSFLFSRQFVIRQNTGVIRLLVLGHVIMGIASVAIMPIAWNSAIPPLRQYFWPLAGSAGFYMLGQLGLFIALRHTDASRTAPLLGLKIVVLACVTIAMMHKTLGWTQWLAVAMSVGAAFVLQNSGGRMHWQALVAILATCVNYSLSDLSIVELVRVLGGVEGWRAPLLAVCMTHILCGVAAAALIPWAGRSSAVEWKRALPFSAAWFVAMIFLYACFGLIGALYGNIVQSTRGLISVVLGAAMASAGMVHLERRVSRLVFLHRAVAAILMSGAIAMFWLESGSLLLQLVLNDEHLSAALGEALANCRHRLFIATANVKDLYVPGRRGRGRSIISVFEELSARGVEVQLLHGGVPSGAFLAEIKRHKPANLLMRRCVRMHAKVIVADGRCMYLGSANLTGAGLGAKSARRRNFEAGIWTDDVSLIDPVADMLAEVFSGGQCGSCGRREHCPVPLEEPRL